MQNIKKRAKNNLQLHLFLLPAVILVIIFNYVPLFGLIMAFQNYKPTKGIFGSPFVGLEHFKTLFNSKDTFQIIWNTFFFASIKIILILFVPLIFALLLNEVKLLSFKRTVQTLVYLPYFLSWVILGGIFVDMLRIDGGLVNQAIGLLGIKPLFFLGNGDLFRFTIIVTSTWKNFGYNAIVILAAIAGINLNLYEAAIIDGGNRWQQTWYITLPSLLPILVVIATLNLGNILNADFDQIFNMYNPLVYSKGDIIDTFVYRMGLVQANYSFSTAVGMFKSVVSFICIVVGYRLAYKFAGYRIF